MWNDVEVVDAVARCRRPSSGHRHPDSWPFRGRPDSSWTSLETPQFYGGVWQVMPLPPSYRIFSWFCGVVCQVDSAQDSSCLLHRAPSVTGGTSMETPQFYGGVWQVMLLPIAYQIVSHFLGVDLSWWHAVVACAHRRLWVPMPIIFVCTVCVCLFRLHMAYMCVWQVAQAETANKRCDLVFVTWLTLLCSRCSFREAMWQRDQESDEAWSGCSLDVV